MPHRRNEIMRKNLSRRIPSTDDAQMVKSTRFALSLVVGLTSGVFSASTHAQNGVPDQTVPVGENGNYSGFNLNYVWQQEVIAGISGTLGGVSLVFYGGSSGNEVHVRLRAGAAPSSSTPLLATTVTKLGSGLDTLFVDASSAGIALTQGDHFVVEVQGKEGNLSDVSGTNNVAAYAGPLYLGGVENPGGRLAFTTYILCSPDLETSACDDGNLCTQDETCQSSACTGTALVCPTADECNVAGTCESATGVCSAQIVASDGTACAGGSCLSGVCTPTGEGGAAGEGGSAGGAGSGGSMPQTGGGGQAPAPTTGGGGQAPAPATGGGGQAPAPATGGGGNASVLEDAPESDKGCGCRTANGSGGSSALAVLAALVIAAAARRGAGLAQSV